MLIPAIILDCVMIEDINIFRNPIGLFSNPPLKPITFSKEFIVKANQTVHFQISVGCNFFNSTKLNIDPNIHQMNILIGHPYSIKEKIFVPITNLNKNHDLKIFEGDIIGNVFI